MRNRRPDPRDERLKLVERIEYEDRRPWVLVHNPVTLLPSQTRTWDLSISSPSQYSAGEPQNCGPLALQTQHGTLEVDVTRRSPPKHLLVS